MARGRRPLRAAPGGDQAPGAGERAWRDGAKGESQGHPADAHVDPEANLDPDAETEPEADVDADANIDPDAEIEPDANIDPKADCEPDGKIDSNAATDPDAGADADPGSQELAHQDSSSPRAAYGDTFGHTASDTDCDASHATTSGARREPIGNSCDSYHRAHDAAGERRRAGGAVGRRAS